MVISDVNDLVEVCLTLFRLFINAPDNVSWVWNSYVDITNISFKDLDK